MATYYIGNRGNSAIQQEVWNVTVAEAKAALPFLSTQKGSYWESVLLKPMRRAVRGKVETFKVYTAGFSTSEFSNALYNGDVTTSERETY